MSIIFQSLCSLECWISGNLPLAGLCCIVQATVAVLNKLPRTFSNAIRAQFLHTYKIALGARQNHANPPWRSSGTRLGAVLAQFWHTFGGFKYAKYAVGWLWRTPGHTFGTLLAHFWRTFGALLWHAPKLWRTSWHTFGALLWHAPKLWRTVWAHSLAQFGRTSWRSSGVITGSGMITRYCRTKLNFCKLMHWTKIQFKIGRAHV